MIAPIKKARQASFEIPTVYMHIFINDAKQNSIFFISIKSNQKVTTQPLTSKDVDKTQSMHFRGIKRCN